MNTKRALFAFAIAVLSSATLACSGDDASEGGGANVGAPPGATGVTQGGSQDFGLFRQILENGEVPGPGTLDEIGFFAEHKLDYPAADCGDDLCMHGLYGAMGNMIDGSSCTLIQIGLNSPIDPNMAGRPPMHLVISVDTSGSMKGDPISYLRAGLHEMLSELQPEDQISLISYAGWAQVRLDAVSAQDEASLRTAFDQLAAAGSTNLYEGLFAAYKLAENHFDPTRQNRVIFMSDGEATAGLTDPARLRALATSYAKQGISLTAIGVGEGFDVDAMRGLGEVGAGNFYFLEDPSAVKEVFSDEVKTFLFPVALDARIGVSVASGYQLRAAYGTTGFKTYGSGGFVDIPALFLAGRTSSEEPITEGRRGGGGAIMLELVPRPGSEGSAPPDLGSLAITWRHPTGGQLVTQETNIVAPHAPGKAPAEGWFSHETVEKGFVMLNIYAGFELAVQLAYDSDPRTARRTLEALRPNVALWLDRHADPDITDDLRYVDMFINNLGEVISRSQPYEPADPPNPWPAD